MSRYTLVDLLRSACTAQITGDQALNDSCRGRQMT